MKTESIKKAAIINIIGKYSTVLINLIYSAILARILSPQEFGVVAVVLVFTTFFSLFTNLGIGPAIVQNKTLDETDNNSIFAFTIYIGIILAILFSLLSYPISLFYKDSVYMKIGILLSISLFFNTLNIVPNALLLKNLKFKKVAYRTVSIGILTAIPTIFLAIKGFSYYSIVIHSILVSLITFYWNFFSSNIKISLKINPESIKKIQEFSKYQFGFSLINYFSRNLDNLLIGRFIGDSALGYYNRSYQLMKYPVQYLTHSITPVLHPILSRYHEDKELIYDKYVVLLKFLSIIGIFVSVYTYFSSKEIILIMFGSQWEGSIRSLELLSISVWGQMLTSSSGSIFQSLNKTKLMMISGSVSTFIIVILIITGIVIGDINSVALLVSIGYFISFIQTFWFLTKFGFQKSFYLFIRTFLVDVFNGIVLFILMYIFINYISFSNLLLSGFIKLLYLGAVYIILITVTKQSKYLINILGLKKITKKYFVFKKKNKSTS